MNKAGNKSQENNISGSRHSMCKGPWVKTECIQEQGNPCGRRVIRRDEEEKAVVVEWSGSRRPLQMVRTLGFIISH